MRRSLLSSSKNPMKVLDEATARNGYQNQKHGNEMVVVAIDASKHVTGYAMEWALGNVVQQGDRIVLLAVVPSINLSSSGWKLWSFPKLGGECTSVSIRSGNREDSKEIKDRCSHMMQQLHKFYDSKKVHITMEIIHLAERGSVATESKRLKATWVVLDRQLKKESSYCLQKLHSNLVLVNRLNAKILRLNLKQQLSGRGLALDEDASIDSSSALLDGMSISVMPKGFDKIYFEEGDDDDDDDDNDDDVTTPETSYTSSSSGSDVAATPMQANKASLTHHKGRASLRSEGGWDTSAERESLSSSESAAKCNSNQLRQPLYDFLLRRDATSVQSQHQERRRRTHSSLSSSSNNSSNSSSHNDKGKAQAAAVTMGHVSNVRQEVMLSTKHHHSFPGPPPLCSICQHKSPVFGKPPKRFSFHELNLATAGFSAANFLAEGGYGSVHRGVLPDGQAIAVKQHKAASSQGDKEFCSEVEVLSCAQHRNLVMLIGYCIEDNRRLLVYEFVCNGSLDSHLYGKLGTLLAWSSRQKIAVGAARGVRYLHEECRVGCIVHRDMRPNNILLTHDFEPMVGDFGLARWQPDGNMGEDTRVIGTFGYLAPEYAQSGQITDKADVYSFGVVLLELASGRKAIDINRPRGQQCLTEWARPLLEEGSLKALVDPGLGDNFNENELCCMLRAALMCIKRDPLVRPRMSQVLRILEGDKLLVSDSISSPSSTWQHSIGSPAGTPGSDRFVSGSPCYTSNGNRLSNKDLYAHYLRTSRLS